LDQLCIVSSSYSKSSSHRVKSAIPFPVISASSNADKRLILLLIGFKSNKCSNVRSRRILAKGHSERSENGLPNGNKDLRDSGQPEFGMVFWLCGDFGINWHCFCYVWSVKGKTRCPGINSWHPSRNYLHEQDGVIAQ
jgi:hypothetical protein